MSNALTLAVTKIGDLLLECKITQDEHNKPIYCINLVLPNYQRPYKWTAKNAIQLLDDIIEAKNANKETYRVGTLILHHDEEDNYNIVDGQQRIITFSLLLKAFGKIEHVEFLDQPLAENEHNVRNIPNNFRALERRINNIADEKEEDSLLDYLKDNCEFIVVITKDISEAFQFFDSQNARGKKLYPHDLLKAYHLREMKDLDIAETEKIVKSWEDLNQKELSAMFSEYLYRIKEWTKGNMAHELTEHNIHKFKGITRLNNYPFAQFYKGAFAYSDMVNNSSMPFVAGIRNLKSFQLDSPIIAGKPFFEYASHYFEILKDIQNNCKYEGQYVNDNDIIKTLEMREFKKGVGNRITRLLFDTAVLFYVDRFCPEKLTKEDSQMLDRFIVFAFVWAYSLRAQYHNLGWQSAQNYIMVKDEYINSFNLYKAIAEVDSPVSLLSVLSDKIDPLPSELIKNEKMRKNLDGQSDDEAYQILLHHFKKHNFLLIKENKSQPCVSLLKKRNKPFIQVKLSSIRNFEEEE